MTTVALVSRSLDLEFMRPLLALQDPSLRICVWPDPDCLDAEVVACWDPPRGLFARMPRLRLVHSIAAGVDNVLDGQDPGDAPVCRVVDDRLAEGMLQYVLWAVLHYHRQLDVVLANQRTRTWVRPAQVAAAQFGVGVMGLGELGGPIARHLSTLGYRVHGWARSARELAGVTVHAGAGALERFLAQAQVLVCLLPLTPSTHGILDAGTFARLPRGAALVHCGRGEHLVQADLLQALDAGHVRGAVLDVFATEPLPVSDPLWSHPRVVVSPHMASMAPFDAVASQIACNIQRLRAGKPLRNMVDRRRGY